MQAALRMVGTAMDAARSVVGVLGTLVSVAKMV